MKKSFFLIIFLASFMTWLETPAFGGGGHDHDHDHGHGHESHEEEPPKRPHGGRLLAKDDFALEITIFEKGVPPQYRLYPYKNGEPIDASEVSVGISLTRFGGKKDEYNLTAKAEYLTSEKVVEEPHSFDVSVTATWRGNAYTWDYESYEGRTELSDEALKVARITIDTAGPQLISQVTNVYGRLVPNQDRVAHIRPRFSGVVREIRKELGDKVEKGEVLAIIESNQSLQPYEIRSQIRGEIIARHATLGEFVTDEKEVFVVADLSEVWADFQVYRDDSDNIERGQPIKVDLGEDASFDAKVTYVAPLTDEVTQSKLVRAVISNPSGRLRPGLFISGSLSSNEKSAALAVRREAIQSFRDWSVVYLTDGKVFQAMPVELGRKDSSYVEVLSGLEAGDRYVSHNSFIIKADIEKSGASHDH
jgi:cobalt-zinc-cadmium efflux system membrane fusion protein